MLLVKPEVSPNALYFQADLNSIKDLERRTWVTSCQNSGLEAKHNHKGTIYHTLEEIAAFTNRMNGIGAVGVVGHINGPSPPTRNGMLFHICFFHNSFTLWQAKIGLYLSF